MSEREIPARRAGARALRRWVGGSALVLSATFLLFLALEWAYATSHLGVRRVSGLGNFEENVRALPPPREGHLRFAVLGDPEEGLGTYRHLMQKAREAGADFVIITGDVADRPTREGFEYFNWVYRSLGSAALPTFAALGNHDVSPLGLFRDYYGPELFSFLHGDCLFIFADNNHPRSFPECESYVRQEIARHRPAARHVFIVVHKPIIDFRREEGDLQNYRETGGYLYRILDEEKVDAVLAGHFHGYLRDDYQGTLLLVTGGGGGLLHAPDAFFHLVLIDVGPGGLKDTLVRADLSDSFWDRLRFRLVVSWYPALFRDWRRSSILILPAGAVLVLGLVLARGGRRAEA